MPLQEGGHERTTGRHTVAGVRADPIQRARDESRAEPALVDRWIDLGVREPELVLAPPILGESDHLAVSHEHEAVCLGLAPKDWPPL